MEKIKKSILKIFLFACLGLTLTTITFARMGGKAPGPPGRPEATNIHRFGCRLTYLAPLDDGGAPIQQYHIEIRTDWDKTWIFKGKTPFLEYDVDGMFGGTEAEFRVLAENEFGKSEPSKPCKVIEFTDPF